MRSTRKTLEQRIEYKSEQLTKKYKKISGKEFVYKMNVIALRMAFLGLEEEINLFLKEKN